MKNSFGGEKKKNLILTGNIVANFALDQLKILDTVSTEIKYFLDLIKLVNENKNT